MPQLRDETRLAALQAAARTMHTGTKDPLGRPRHEHFDRVAQRLLDRSPDAPQSWVEAALLHDILIHPNGGERFLRENEVVPETVAILQLILPPPNANYFQAIETFTAQDNADYLAYIRGLVDSRDRGAIAVKLADVEDTVELLRSAGTDVTMTQLERQYEPSRRLLEEGYGQLPSASVRA